MIPTLRTLTRKSKLGFGKHKNLTVQKVLDLKLNIVLVSAYFKLTSINFTDDILNEIHIKKEDRIIKPSANIDAYYNFLENSYYYKSKDQKVDMGYGADKLRKQSKPFSKSQLQGFNHGR